VARPDGSLLDPGFVAALDRQDAQRLRGAGVLSVVEGDAAATLADWAAWAAGCGYLTLVTRADGLDAAIGELLAQTPWLRCLTEARRRLAEAAELDVDAVDAALDARWGDERGRWIDDIAGLDPRVRVSGWLLSALRAPGGRVPDLAAAPVQGGALLAILCELATPIAVLAYRPEPTAEWLERAIATAAALIAYLPGRSIAVGAPRELVSRVLDGDRRSAALSMARQGRVRVASRASRPPARAADRCVQALHGELDRDRRTRGLFEPSTQVPIRDGGAEIAVDLVARGARLVVAIDRWYRDSDLQGYRRDRDEDHRLQRAGYFVMRFAAEDIDHRLALVVNEIAIGLAGRRASSDLSGESP
jgi:very-short-patch-repair endonuclease